MSTRVPVSQAVSVEDLYETYYEGPAWTIGGVVCGACTTAERSWDRNAAQVHHASVEHVRYCYSVRSSQEQEAAAEIEAERRNERFFEERGAGLDDPRDWGISSLSLTW